jgi:long-chain fatty acid transport protein
MTSVIFSPEYKIFKEITMKNKYQLLPLAALLLSTQALATDGYFSHGYGVKSQGMGGVGIALPQDALAAATNPAGMGLIGDRIDFGVTWFRPIREAEIEGNGAGMNGTYKANESKNFFIPEFGYNKVINDQLSLGVSVYGNGGMNTDYNRPIPLFGNTKAGIDMAQLFIAPTLAWKINETHTVGVSVNLAYQRFEAKGLQNFDNGNYSSSVGNVTNRGHDNSYGAGLHLGWIGKINDAVSLGATYQTKTYMTKFDKYKGLFAEQGDFDVPEQYGVGVAIKASPKLTLAADVQRINYGDVDSVGASITNMTVRQIPLGDNNGAGFAWRDVTAYKLGASYAWDDNLTLRAGYNHSSQPIRKSETLFNMLAPGVVQDHLTLGATWVLPNKSELSFAYMHAFEKKVNGSNSIPGGPNGFGGGDANLKMHEDSLGIAYGWNI